MSVLRPYQLRAIAALRASYASGHRAPMLVAPTGAGKTLIAAEIIRSAAARGNRTLFVAPRRELIRQTAAKLSDAGVADPRIIVAADDLGSRDATVTIGSIQTLTLERWRSVLPPADLLICDEAHHMAADGWSALARAYPHARILGLTATPERADGRPMGDIFDDIVVAATVRELTDLGHLAPARFWAPPSLLESGELAMDPLAAYRQHGAGQSTVIFCATVDHAERICASIGDGAATVSGRTSETARDSALARFAVGELRVLCSVGVLTEGWDAPIASVAILARRFGHAGLFLQVVGRVLRPHPDKIQATIIDLCGSVHEHGTPDMEREYSLIGKAIVRKDSITQCKTCGSVFLAGPATCPYCGVARPLAPASIPQDTGVGVAPLEPPKPKREFFVRMVSKRHGQCAACKRAIAPGDAILWATLAKTATHTMC
jgi:DNA repair protein RadD